MQMPDIPAPIIATLNDRLCFIATTRPFRWPEDYADGLGLSTVNARPCELIAASGAR
jgi:hypothetical protein